MRLDRIWTVVVKPTRHLKDVLRRLVLVRQNKRPQTTAVRRLMVVSRLNVGRYPHLPTLEDQRPYLTGALFLFFK
jgi:hypothetical protein